MSCDVSANASGALGTGDFNRDGQLDHATANSFGSSVTLLLNTALSPSSVALSARSGHPGARPHTIAASYSGDSCLRARPARR